MWAELIGALAGGMFSGLSSADRQNQQEANLNQAKNTLKQTLLTQEDIDNLLNKNSRAWNVSLGNLLNMTAIRTRGTANAPVVGAAVASGMEAQKLQSNVQIEQGALNQNRATMAQIAQLEAGAPVSDTIGEIFGGATAGFTTGMEFDKLGMFNNKLNPTTATPEIQTLKDISFNTPNYSNRNFDDYLSWQEPLKKKKNPLEISDFGGR